MSQPRIWGKHFWYTLHLSALGYPDKPTPEDIQAYKAVYLNFGRILPCKKCSANYLKHLEHLPIDKALENKSKLFAWTVDLHNIVNQATGKSIWNKEYAEAFFMSGGYDNCHCSDAKTEQLVWQVLMIIMIILNLIIIFMLVKKVLTR
jgi:hypothetical protein